MIDDEQKKGQSNFCFMFVCVYHSNLTRHYVNFISKNANYKTHTHMLSFSVCLDKMFSDSTLHMAPATPEPVSHQKGRANISGKNPPSFYLVTNLIQLSAN